MLTRMRMQSDSLQHLCDGQCYAFRRNLESISYGCLWVMQVVIVNVVVCVVFRA